MQEVQASDKEIWEEKGQATPREYKYSEKWRHVLFVRTKQDKLDQKRDFDAENHQEEEAAKYSEYFEINRKSLQGINTGIIINEYGKAELINKDRVDALLDLLEENNGNQTISYRINDWALAEMINKNLRFKLGGQFTNQSDIDWIKNKVKPAMSGTKRSILFKNSSNVEVLYQKYSETKKITNIASKIFL